MTLDKSVSVSSDTALSNKMVCLFFSYWWFCENPEKANNKYNHKKSSITRLFGQKVDKILKTNHLVNIKKKSKYIGVSNIEHQKDCSSCGLIAILMTGFIASLILQGKKFNWEEIKKQRIQPIRVQWRHPKTIA